MPAPLTPPPPVAPSASPGPADALSAGPAGPGVRRIVLTAALSALLLVGGAAAVVSAASPDPSASPAPATNGSGNGGTTAPSTRPNHSGAMPGGDCPNMGGSGSSGSSGGSSAPS